MADGPGKYDDFCTFLREEADADGVVVIVFRGRRGTGMSCQASAEIMAVLPNLLRTIADEIPNAVHPMSGEESN